MNLIIPETTNYGFGKITVLKDSRTRRKSFELSGRFNNDRSTGGSNSGASTASCKSATTARASGLEQYRFASFATDHFASAASRGDIAGGASMASTKTATTAGGNTASRGTNWNTSRSGQVSNSIKEADKHSANTANGATNCTANFGERRSANNNRCTFKFSDNRFASRNNRGTDRFNNRNTTSATTANSATASNPATASANTTALVPEAVLLFQREPTPTQQWGTAWHTGTTDSTRLNGTGNSTSRLNHDRVTSRNNGGTGNRSTGATGKQTFQTAKDFARATATADTSITRCCIVASGTFLGIGMSRR